MPGTAEILLGASELESLAAAVEAARPAMLVEGLVGADGSSYTLQIEAGMTSGTWKWWLAVPAGWESLAAVGDEVEAIFRAEAKRQFELK